MHVDTEKVARRAHAWYRAGIPTWWVTVLTTFGSSPAPVGSTLAVNESEACVGGIGMPNIDQAVIRRVLAHTPSEPVVWSLGDQIDSAGALGLPVGADPVVVQVEPLTDARADGLAVLADMLSQRQSAETVVVHTSVSSSGVSKQSGLFVLCANNGSQAFAKRTGVASKVGIFAARKNGQATQSVNTWPVSIGV